MTTIAVLADPPRSGLVLPGLAETTPLTEREAADLYGAMLADVCRAVEGSGGELLVNYRGDETLPEAFVTDDDPEASVRAAVEPGLKEPDSARYEVQVGSTRSARIGNTVSHLLNSEGVATAAVVDPTAPMVGRQHVDNAAMKLRLSNVVLGPASDGRVYYAGFSDPIDFEDALAPPAIETLTDRGIDAGHDVDFLPMLPVVETDRDLVTLVTQIRAREAAGAIRPPNTTEWLNDVGLVVVRNDGGLGLRRD